MIVITPRGGKTRVPCRIRYPDLGRMDCIRTQLLRALAENGYGRKEKERDTTCQNQKNSHLGKERKPISMVKISRNKQSFAHAAHFFIFAICTVWENSYFYKYKSTGGRCTMTGWPAGHTDGTFPPAGCNAHRSCEVVSWR